jgi:hypothetical protein
VFFVELRRKKTGEKVERFEHRDDPDLADLRRRLRRWALDNEDALRAATPAMPEGFDNRRADNWRIMLAIADLCSGAEEWGDKARAAAIKIEGASDTRTANVRALAAIKAIFAQADSAQIEGGHRKSWSISWPLTRIRNGPSGGMASRSRKRNWRDC